MSVWLIISISFGYLFVLFGVAYWGERLASKGKSLVNNAYVYALSLTVYCTAWTYYGSVGRATSHGIEFLTIYLGPTLVVLLGWGVMRKILRICKVQHITSIADFISSRYGKSTTLGVIVSILCLIGITPYIAIQIKAIANSFEIITFSIDNSNLQHLFLQDTAFYITGILAIFTILFGTRHLEVTEQHEGLVTTIAFESLFKLFAFLLVGYFVTYELFDGFGDVFSQAQNLPELQQLSTLKNDTGTWFFLTSLSMLAFLFLPRQFQMAVVENHNERHLKKTTWLFPLYLWLINLFVLPIAFGGKILFAKMGIDADTFVLVLPLAYDQDILALLVYLGGFSASTSMIIVSTVALSTMISNNLLMPILVVILRKQSMYHNRWRSIVKYSRRFSILLVLLLAYLYFRIVATGFSLVSIGLISFVAVAQFGPAILGGIYWKKGTKIGALVGILVGAVVWAYTLVLPTIIETNLISKQILTEGLFGLSILKPHAFLGLEVLDPISQGFFWSLLLNTSCYLGFSFLTRQSSQEHKQALVFVDIFKYSTVLESSVIWKGTAYTPDVYSLLSNFLGKTKTERSLNTFLEQEGLTQTKNNQANPKLVDYAEKLLAGTIGAASAQVMIASVVKEKEISRAEVINILRESQQLIFLNQELERKSLELQQVTQNLKIANDNLRRVDQLKNDFISTVTHELRTPITSIKAFSEIILDNPDLEMEERQHFLETISKESERMERLISQVLDLEKFESGKQSLNLESIQLNQLVKEALDAVSQLIRDKNIALEISLQPNIPDMEVDSDRILQVILNLLSNAIKYCHPQKGEIKVYSTYFQVNQKIRITIKNNGNSIPSENQEFLFDKFFQAKNQTLKKPEGTGLGLAISKKIVEAHQGNIWLESNPQTLTSFFFELPID